MPRLLRLSGLTIAALAAALLAPAPAVTAVPSTVAATEGQQAPDPNIVVVQLDDVSRNLMQTMSQAERMGDEGLRFTNSFVVDSLCCPSRAAFFLGRTPHHTGVRTNTAGTDEDDPTGGWEAFNTEANLEQTFHARLKESGYTTGFVGKFLNGYTAKVARSTGPVDGWSSFVPVYPSGYQGWGFEYGRRVGETMRNGTWKTPPASASRRQKDRRYVQTFIEQEALRFIDEHEGREKPYLYVVSPYAAHSSVRKKAYPDDPKFPAAFQDRPRPEKPQGNCGKVACGRLDVRNAPAWDDSRKGNLPQRLVDGRIVPGTHWRPAPRQVEETAGSLNAKFRQRAQMLQSVDRTLEKILDRVGENTYVVLTSDNGYHLGQYQLDGGKGTPYDTDTRVPLYVVGPDVPAGGTRNQQVSNLDLAPTFERLAGIGAEDAPYRDGVSFENLLKPGRGTAEGGRFTFFEHTRDRRNGPDGRAEGDSRLEFIPSYVGVRSARGLLVRLDLDPDPRPKQVRYAWELYDYRGAEFERTNLFARDHQKGWVEDLIEKVRAWSTCAPGACDELTR